MQRRNLGEIYFKTVHLVLYFDLKCSDRVLSPDVFINKDFVDPTPPRWTLSPASELGARLSKGHCTFCESFLITASVNAWQYTFKGDAANVLIRVISNYLSKDRPVYTRHTSIVNSSGTGKSRIVDQVAREIITVPMCLREHGSQGFKFQPPCLLFRSAYNVILQDTLLLILNFEFGLLQLTQMTKPARQRSYMHSCARF